MSFDQDTNESVTISGSDFAEMCDEIQTMKATINEMLEVLLLCDDAMDYMSEYDIPLLLPEQVKKAIAKARG